MDYIFPYVREVYGGTEYMGKTFHKEVLPKLSKLKNYHCLIIPGIVAPLDKYLADDKQFIVWMHNTPKQFTSHVLTFLNNPKFREKLKWIVVPSEAHKQITHEETGIELDKIYVIPNAIIPADSNLDRFDKPKEIKLVFTSAFDRGLPLLLDALDRVENNFALEIYNDFNPDLIDNLPKLKSNIKFYGKTPKATVQSALAQAHIFAYPTVFFETFCLSLAESMSAGLYLIYPDYGALKEISGGRGDMYEYPEDIQTHIDIHAKKIDTAIEMIMRGDWDPREQIEYINNKYSWSNITKQWLAFEGTL